jgi:ubiquitin C-terminal hydrolase
MNRLECKKCGHKSYAFDNFMDLSVPFPRSAFRMTGVVGLKECLEAYIKPERMEECGFKCTKCKHVDNFEKELTVYRFPKILVVHLKRFYNSTVRREKINTTVKIPL